jgi:hypothetical protein
VSQGDVALLTFNLINHEPVRLADTAASVPVNNTTGVSTVGPTAATVLGGTLDVRFAVANPLVCILAGVLIDRVYRNHSSFCSRAQD